MRVKKVENMFHVREGGKRNSKERIRENYFKMLSDNKHHVDIFQMSSRVDNNKTSDDPNFKSCFYNTAPRIVAFKYSRAFEDSKNI